MGRPKKTTGELVLEAYQTHKTVGKAADALGLSTRTVQRYLHAQGVRPPTGRPFDIPVEEDHLAIAQGRARELPDLRRFTQTLRDVEGRAVPLNTIGAYTLKVARSDPDYLHMMATLRNGTEVEIKTSFSYLKGVLHE